MGNNTHTRLFKNLKPSDYNEFRAGKISPKKKKDIKKKTRAREIFEKKEKTAEKGKRKKIAKAMFCSKWPHSGSS